MNRKSTTIAWLDSKPKGEIAMQRLCLLLLLVMTIATAARLAKADGGGTPTCPQGKSCKP